MSAYNSFATVNPGAGRPSGGISIYIRYGGPKMKIVHSDECSLLLSCNNFSMGAFYLQPNCSIEEVLSIVGDRMAKLDFTKLVIVGGDFNCRIDSPSTTNRGSILLEFMESLGLLCQNRAEEQTYICFNGGSTRDLVFTNGIARNIKVEDLEVRKHLPMKLRIPLKGFKSPPQMRTLSRKIRKRKLGAVGRASVPISSDSDLNEIEATITAKVMSCCDSRKQWKRTAQRWFNSTCYRSRREVLALLRESRSDPAARTRYCQARRQYHSVPISMKKNFELEEERKLLLEVQQRPYLYLKRRRKGLEPLLQPEEVKCHFDRLLWNEDASDRPSVLSQLPLTAEQHIINQLFTEVEISHVLCSLPSRKSAGPSGCYYEHWRQTEKVILRDLRILFNKILDQGRLPSTWHRARLSLLFKGGVHDNRSDLNLYRGIASEETLKKVFCKLLISRMEPLLDESLPCEQFGFRRGVGTLDAIHYFLSEVERTVSAHGKIYAVFIDCTKAFDKASRALMLQSFADVGVGGQALKIIDSFFGEDHLEIQLQHEKVHVSQNDGTPQGNPLSCLAFILLIRNLVDFIRSEPKAFVALYADDIVIAHPNLNGLRSVLPRISTLLRARGLEINRNKTKVVKFGRSARLGKDDHLKLEGQPLEFVKTFKYLGVRFHYSVSNFHAHVEERVCQALTASYDDIKKLNRLSLDSAIILFKMKLMPVISYGLTRIWKYLTVKDLKKLEQCFTLYMKRALCLNRAARSRYVYVLSGAPLMIDVMRQRIRGDQTAAFSCMLQEWSKKVNDALTEVSREDIFKKPELWAGSGLDDRHKFTRYLVHGYHHRICTNSEFHDADENVCTCRYCGLLCGKYHATRCLAGKVSLHGLSRM
ncbi:uncharacterized protein LOC108864068 [Galendromus occidentalis]|uniref:Uncharacterized protein LOC108864068 n=1 Tax=Galendromus occidentalis TaxID=34638 RepID=A0AAJ7P9F9_9ACAR|nr:uncharacterized protein LOC108864068 [Galendromus occidentalis]